LIYLIQNNGAKTMNKWEQKDDILFSLDEFIKLDELSDDDNLLVVALYRLLDMFYQEEGEEGFDYIKEIWEQIKNLER